jgi:hypothetical protein
MNRTEQQVDDEFYISAMINKTVIKTQTFTEAERINELLSLLGFFYKEPEFEKVLFSALATASARTRDMLWQKEKL